MEGASPMEADAIAMAAENYLSIPLKHSNLVRVKTNSTLF